MKKSYEKFRNMSEEDFKKMQAIEQEVFALMKKVAETKDPTSADARKLAEKHKEWLMFSWPDYSKEAHQGLAETMLPTNFFPPIMIKLLPAEQRFSGMRLCITSTNKENRVFPSRGNAFFLLR